MPKLAKAMTWLDKFDLKIKNTTFGFRASQHASIWRYALAQFEIHQEELLSVGSRVKNGRRINVFIS